MLFIFSIVLIDEGENTDTKGKLWVFWNFYDEPYKFLLNFGWLFSNWFSIWLIMIIFRDQLKKNVVSKKLIKKKKKSSKEIGKVFFLNLPQKNYNKSTSHIFWAKLLMYFCKKLFEFVIFSIQLTCRIPCKAITIILFQNWKPNKQFRLKLL